MADIAESRNHFRSIHGDTPSGDASVGVPADTPGYCPVECFILLAGEVEVYVGGSKLYAFSYFVGHHPESANKFGIEWYENRKSKRNGDSPLPPDTVGLPLTFFRPAFPVYNPFKVETGKVEFITPADSPFTELYPVLQLIKED